MTHERAADSGLMVSLLPTPHCEVGTGVAAPGALYVLADSVLGWLALQEVAADEFIVTSNLHLDIVGEARMTSRMVVEHPRVVSLTDRGVLTTGEIVDESGRLLALMSGRFAIVRRDSRNAGSVGEATAAVSPQRVVTDLSGAGGGDPDGPGRLFGLERDDRADVEVGTVAYVARARPELANDRGGLHGGIAGMLGEYAAARALRVARPDVPYVSVEGRAVFLRPLPARGAEISCLVKVLHTGQRQAVTVTSLLDERGRVAIEVAGVFSRRS